MTILRLVRTLVSFFVRLSWRMVFLLGGCAALLFVILLAAEGVASLFKPPTDQPDFARAYSQTAILKSADSMDRDVRLLIKPAVFEGYLSLYNGLRLVPNWFPLTWTGPEIKLGPPRVTADLGHLNATAEVSVWQLPLLAVDLSLVFDRVAVKTYKIPEEAEEAAKDHDCELVFIPHLRRIAAPGRFQRFLEATLPRVTHYWQLALGGLIDRAANARRPDGTYPIEIKLKVPRRVVLPLGVNQEDRLPFYPPNGDPPEIGAIVLKTVLPETRITRFFNYDYPIITPDGIWLFATVQSDEPKWITSDRLLSNAKPIDAPATDSQPSDLTGALLKLSAKIPANASHELWLGANALLGIVDEIKSIDRAHRTATITMVSSTGKVYRVQPKDDNVIILSALQLFADIPNSSGIRGNVVIEDIGAQKGPKGIELTASAVGHVETSIRIFSDLIAVAQQQVFSFDAKGDSKHTPFKTHLSAFVATTSVKDVSYAAAFWGLDSDCTVANVSAKTGSGKLGSVLPITFSDTVVNLPQKLFKEKNKGSLIISALPSRNALINRRQPDTSTTRGGEPKQTSVERFLSQFKKPFYELRAPSDGIEIGIVPVEANVSSDGYQLTANLKFASVTDSTFSELEKKERQAVLDKIKDVRFPGEQHCADTHAQVFVEGIDVGLLAGDIMKVVNAIANNEKAKLDLAVALYKGKNVGPAAEAVLKSELDKVGATTTAAGDMTEASLKHAAEVADRAVKNGTKIFDDAAGITAGAAAAAANTATGLAEGAGNAIGGTAGAAVSAGAGVASTLNNKAIGVAKGGANAATGLAKGAGSAASGALRKGGEAMGGAGRAAGKLIGR